MKTITLILALMLSMSISAQDYTEHDDTITFLKSGNWHLESEIIGYEYILSEYIPDYEKHPLRDYSSISVSVYNNCQPPKDYIRKIAIIEYKD